MLQRGLQAGGQKGGGHVRCVDHRGEPQLPPRRRRVRAGRRLVYVAEGRHGLGRRGARRSGPRQGMPAGAVAGGDWARGPLRRALQPRAARPVLRRRRSAGAAGRVGVPGSRHSVPGKGPDAALVLHPAAAHHRPHARDRPLRRSAGAGRPGAGRDLRHCGRRDVAAVQGPPREGARGRGAAAGARGQAAGPRGRPRRRIGEGVQVEDPGQHRLLVGGHGHGHGPRHGRPPGALGDAAGELQPAGAGQDAPQRGAHRGPRGAGAAPRAGVGRDDDGGAGPGRGGAARAVGG
mmetsp:Transcript_96295/g.294527  ORF Transcript_96295/g.294527 Transcript_96295/m.294527 type:complete len:291 (+) Transcript_96295:455-1327(+)